MRAQIESLNHELGEKFEHITALEAALSQRDTKTQEVVDRVVAERNRALADVEHFRRAFEECSQERHGLQQEVMAYRGTARPSDPETFREAIQSAINRFSKESGSDTPDFILAAFLCNVLGSFDTALKARTKWYSAPKTVGPVGVAESKASYICDCLDCKRAAEQSDVTG